MSARHRESGLTNQNVLRPRKSPPQRRQKDVQAGRHAIPPAITIARGTMAVTNWRTIDIDALDPESCAHFDLSTLTPNVTSVSTHQVQTVSGQIKQLQRGGDNEGALRGALENPPYGADEQGKVR